MRLLLITVAYPPYIFSESLCNAKLVLNLQRAGFHVDVISREGMGPSYSGEWEEPWCQLRENLHEISYSRGISISRLVDVLYSCFKLGSNIPIEGIRWARRALDLAIRLHREKAYDAVLTRSPSDIPHLIGRALHRITGIKWLANWNDPAVTIWPAPYGAELSKRFVRKYNKIVQSCLNEASVNTFPCIHLLQHFQETFIVPNGTVVPHVQLPDALFERAEKKRTAVFTMCHAGNLSAERNPARLFQAMRMAMDSCGNEMQLHIMGQYSAAIEKLAEDAGVKTNVHFIGACEYMESLKKMQNYDALVMVEAELTRGIFAPSKLTDYAQCGLPLLFVSPIDGYSCDISRKSSLCVHADNCDTADISNGIIHLYKNWEHGNSRNQLEKLSHTAGYDGENVVRLYREILEQ